MTKTFSRWNKSGNFLLGASKFIIMGVGIGMAWLPYQSASIAQTCNAFGCSKPNAGPCNVFGCPNPGASECNVFGCPPSPAYGEEQRQDWEGRSRRDRDEIYDKIDEIYQKALGRDADREGLRTYRRRLESGWSLEQVRRDVANSSEAEEAINSIYQQELGRDADREGLRTYRKRLESGWSLNQVHREIAKSKEARDRRH